MKHVHMTVQTVVPAVESRDPESLLEPPHKDSSIKKVIGVISGKGG